MHTLPSTLEASESLSAALVADAVTRRYGARIAVRDVSLTLAAGDCLALFGPNGAGKTTLLRLLGGLLKPNSGRVTLLDHELPGEAQTRRLLGVISHRSMLYDALTVRENVMFAAECQGLVNASAATEAVLKQLLVFDRSNSPVRALSRGLQQRVSIARALVHGPRLVLLDEPYTGLDQTGARALTDALRALKASGATVVLVTHNLPEGLELATHAAIMLNGAFVHRAERPSEGFDVTSYAALYRELVGGGE
jgi:heme exporter protein A